MSAEILEVHWGPALIAALGKWLVERGQLRQMTAADMATPEMVELSASGRGGEVFQAVRELRTVLNAHAVKVIDLELRETLQEKLRGTRPLLGRRSEDGSRKVAETPRTENGGSDGN